VKEAVQDRLSWKTRECSGDVKGERDHRNLTLKYDFHQMECRPFSAIRA
jgi:hypothetical protein